MSRAVGRPALPYGTLLVLGAGSTFKLSPLAGVAASLAAACDWRQVVLRHLLGSSSLPWAGLLLLAFDLFVSLPSKRRAGGARRSASVRSEGTVALTARSDEESAGLARAGFLARPRVRGIERNLSRTLPADVVHRARIVGQFREQRTGLSTFLYSGSPFTGKPLELKLVGIGTFDDVGAVCKLGRNDALKRLLPLLYPRVNLEFSACFVDRVLAHWFYLVDCPGSFHARPGSGKVGNANHLGALLGLRAIAGILTGWRAPRAGF